VNINTFNVATHAIVPSRLHEVETLKVDIINASTTIVQQLHLSDCTIVHYYRCMGAAKIQRLYGCERHALDLFTQG
jgi:hypothetical protein